MTKLSEFTLGDMRVLYFKDGEGCCSVLLLPAAVSLSPEDIKKDMRPESLVQYKLAGDCYNGGFSQGHSLRNGESVKRLKFQGQKVNKTEETLEIITSLRDERGYEASHILKYQDGREYMTMSCRFGNLSAETVSLEMIESFSLPYLTPCIPGDAPDSLSLFRLRSAWSAEGRVEQRSAEELLLERSWSGHGVRCERYGQAGSLPVNQFFPFGAVYDSVNHIFWGAFLKANASWQMSFYRRDDGLSFSGGLADRELGGWIKNVGPGETFETPEAIVSCAGETDFTMFCQRLTSYGLEGFLTSAPLEKELPVVFNEYCSTWGNPSEARIKKLLEVLKGKDIAYFVIDSGWYNQDGSDWEDRIGDYEVSKELFPEGLKYTAELIKETGFVPGLWFEIENVGQYAKIAQREEFLLKRDGKVIKTDSRRFLDMRRPETIERLREKVIGTLKDNGFGYIKIDYNETIGPGCDGAESPGEGLLQNMKASADFIREIRQSIKDIVVENCASGGHRLEPLSMGLCSMASFSDAHECAEIPVIAANLHNAILPCQSQIWAVLRKEDSIKRIVYSLSATCLGRMCISGDVEQLSKEQWKAANQGIAFYREAAEVILNGRSRIYRNGLSSMRHPKGWQALVRSAEKRVLIVIHGFEGAGGTELTVPLPSRLKGRIQQLYAAFPHEECAFTEEGLFLRFAEDFEGLALLAE
ncbi:MAG: alpha-galactosidase [Lachnospiraceae bacterium]|nr:alpha-galactosidase [Lachnospiraceae bacterium]